MLIVMHFVKGWNLHMKTMKQTVTLTFLLITAVIAYFSLILAMFYFPFASRNTTTPIDSSVQNTNEYLSSWNISLSGCKESYYASSDHSSFGEGFRYSVLSGSISSPSPNCNKRGEHLTKTIGRGTELNITWFLNDVWSALEVPTENRCSTAQCDWTLFSTNNNSKLLIVTSKKDNAVYIAEQLLWWRNLEISCLLGNKKGGSIIKDVPAFLF